MDQTCYREGVRLTDAYDLIRLPDDERKAVIEDTFDLLGIHGMFVEKDLWVTVLLKFLFEESLFRDSLLFKGGTCLSKCYSAINRFSEDVDLLLDWRVLGYPFDGPEVQPTRKKQDRSNRSLVNAVSRYVRDVATPVVRDGLSRILGVPLDVCSEGSDVVVNCPSLYVGSYVRNRVLLEIGCRGRWKDVEVRSVGPLVFDVFPELSSDFVSVKAIPLDAAYCEKIAILHSVAVSGKVNDRYSRHYFDVYELFRRFHPVVSDGSLAEIVEFNRRMYPGSRYGYDTLAVGTLKLVPSRETVELLKSDYARMADMIYVEAPSFDEILLLLADIEREINGNR